MQARNPILQDDDDEQAVAVVHQCLTTLKAHSSYVSTLAVHGESLYSGSSDHHIRLWPPLPSSGHSHVVALSTSPIKSLLVIPTATQSQNLLATAHLDHKIRVWQIDHRHDHHGNKEKKRHHQYRLLSTLPTPADRLLSLLSPSKHVLVRRHKRCAWVSHADAVSGLAAAADGSVLYSVSWDRSIKAWRTSDFRCVDSIPGAHHDAINAVAVSPEDGTVYTGSADGAVKAWRRRPGGRGHELVATMERHGAAVNALAVSGPVLYSGGGDRLVVVWEGSEAVGVLGGHSAAVLSLTAAGSLVCSGSADRTVRVWRRRGRSWYSCLAVMEGHGGAVKSLAMAMVGVDDSGIPRRLRSDGNGLFAWSSYIVYSGGLDCEIKVWKVLGPPEEEEE